MDVEDVEVEEFCVDVCEDVLVGEAVEVDVFWFEMVVWGGVILRAGKCVFVAGVLVAVCLLGGLEEWELFV